MSDNTTPSVPPEPAKKHVNLMLLAAIREGASEIHIAPIGVRFLVDGKPNEHTLPADAAIDAMIGRLKYMAGLDVEQRQQPQQGCIMAKVNNAEIDFHLSTSPAADGESATVRIAPRARS
jgi:type II secretory ATPase GspE/PulE/Tfp pilus assembly ATPase PilB-like protein